MTHSTLTKFNYPDSLIREYTHWCVLLRPAQATLGALVLVNKGVQTAFGDVGPEAFGELQTVIKDSEHTLRTLFHFDKINYVMLMMVDPQVHFHVLPRYETAREFDGDLFRDAYWPKPVDLTQPTPALSPERHAGLLKSLQEAWPA